MVDRPKFVCFVDSDGFWVGEESKWGQDAETDRTPELSWDDICQDNPLLYGFLPGVERGKDPKFDDVILAAHNRNHLWAILRELAQEFRVATGRRMASPEIHIQMACGNTMDYKAFDDIPIESELCECSLEWVIYYTAPWTKNIPK